MDFVPPMVSASPPPMSPDDTAENISDSDCDEFSAGDVDLTGLSDKLGSIPLDVIRAPPLPSPSESDFTNGASLSPELDRLGGDTTQATPCPNTNSKPGDVPYETEGSRTCDDDETSEVQPVQVHGNEKPSDNENLDGNHICDFNLKFPENSEAVISSQECFVASVKVPSTDGQPVQAHENAKGSDNNGNFSDQPCDFNSTFPEGCRTSASHEWLTDSEQVPSVTGGQFTLAQENAPCSGRENFVDEFCDFDSVFPESGVTAASHNWFVASEQVPSSTDTKGQDFGDFSFAPSTSLPAGKEGDPVVDILYKLEKTLSAVIDVEFKNNKDGCESNVKKEAFKSLEEMVKDEQIWSDIFDAGTTPAMRLTWKTSLSRDKLYKVLNVDPSIVTAERNNPMPAFASGLALAGLLEPTALTPPSTRDPVSSPQSGGSTAQQSGSDPELLGKLETRDSAAQNLSDESKADRSHRQLSSQARAIVDAFPLLDFMRSPILMCPITDTKNKLT